METTVRPFGWRDKIGYALGDFGCNMSFAFINSYMMLFFVTCLGILPQHYAVIIIIAKVWDAINDPIIGGICDISHPRGNSKFKPWIKWASLPLLAASVLMFLYVPNAPYGVRVALCLGTYMIWSVAYTSVNVPYGSLQSVITKDRLQRVELSNYRSIGAMLAQAPVLILLPMLVYDDNDNPRGELFIYIVAIMGVIGLVSFQLLCKLVTERVQNEPAPHQGHYLLTLVRSLGKTLLAFFRNRPMMALTISTVAYTALVMTVTNSMQYLFMLYFRNTRLIPLASVLAGGPVLLAILFVKPLAKRFSKKAITTYPFLLSIVSTGILTFVKIQNPYVWLTIFAVGMFAAGFYTVLIWAMVADCIDFQEKRTGTREEGAIYATYSLFRKLAQGIGSAAVSLAIGWAGYVQTNGVDQVPGVAENIYFVVSLLPFIGNVICFVSMFLLYNIKEEKDEKKNA